MKITYDKCVDALNVSIRSGKIAKTLEIAPEVMIDVDKSGKVLNLEILGAREKVGRKNMDTVYVGGRAIALKA